ncbi:MAG: 1-acyl-sn-glycerol-3-phosphate acyltransferase [Ignavibacteriae bacterium]|nr:1-acyl-sn-glycerol-3-phosphate acyltransferase [Ignavibacteriota bacterium]
MNYKTYPRKIAEVDSYVSKPFKPSFFQTLSFYPKVISIFLGANLLTKRNLYNRFNWVGTSLQIFDTLESVGVKLEISGMNHIRSLDGPVVFVANHMSMLETLILPSLIQPYNSLVYVTKKQLSSMPIFGPLNISRHNIIVGRENPREDLKTVIEEGFRRIANGRSVLIFPQKTRASKFNASSFNTLGIKLAKKNGVKVVPIAVISDAWTNGKILKDFGKLDISKKVHIEFGTPLDIKGNGSEQHTEVLKFIEQKFRDWNRSELIED